MSRPLGFELDFRDYVTFLAVVAGLAFFGWLPGFGKAAVIAKP